ncbi:AAA family ATPase [Mycobacterium sp. WMMD1722]|uniref:bifunctional aminoglycoside phosphotransferase/ATP-binding protein n=1 Tax=Mycobacterium sp. WMMD1722 TaxID=3404117 RepID=UPI003BF5A90F
MTTIEDSPAADETSPAVDMAAAAHETHTGVVVLLGDRAYKIKKPVLTDFLDFSTTERRERACRREVELNRRLAAESYLGVGHLQLPGRTTAEPVVVMRRYPDHDRLRHMVLRGESVDRHLIGIAGLLADFHARSPRSADIDASGTAVAVTGRWTDTLDVLDDYTDTVLPETTVTEIRRLAIRYLAGREPLFAGRIADSRIVDGHGDLLTDDIFCTPGGPVLLDCLEFDDRLRFVDAIDDAAFLAMDLEYLGRKDLADLFLDAYRERAGDTAPRSLIDFYIAYRAVVRAKVDCIRVSQGHGTAAADARWHLELAANHLRATTVRLVLVGGGPGTGKTTLAGGLGTALGAQVISTDVVRRELQTRGLLDGETGALNAGLYAPESVEFVYDTVLLRAQTLLDHGQSVILDGTWRDPAHRRAARETAERTSAAYVELACTTTLAAAQQRIQQRASTTSDATAQIAADLTTPPWPDAHHVDTGRPLAESLAEAQQICCLAI